MNQKRFVLALIKDYIIYSRLNNGLSATGLDTEEFSVNLGNTIFEVMELGNDEISDERFSEFLSVTEKIMQFDVSEWRNEVNPIANEAFALLLNWKVRA
jgi:hypothetical protein